MRLRVMLASVSLLGITACGVDIDAPLAPGRVVGTVRLLGEGGPVPAPGARVEFYDNETDLEMRRNAIVAAPLDAMGDTGRSFAFGMERVPAGAYFVMTCFTQVLGCAEYRNGNALQLVRVKPDETTQLDMAF